MPPLLPPFWLVLQEHLGVEAVQPRSSQGLLWEAWGGEENLRRHRPYTTQQHGACSGGSWHGGAAGSPPRPSGFHSFLPKVGSDRGCPRGRAEQLKAEGPKNSLSGRPAWNGAAAARRCQFSWLFAPRVGLFVVYFLAVLRNARGTGTASKPSRDRGKRGELEALWLLPPTAGAASRLRLLQMFGVSCGSRCAGHSLPGSPWPTRAANAPVCSGQPSCAFLAPFPARLLPLLH